MTIKITKQLATKQDLALGTGKVVQQRNGVYVELDRIDMVTTEELDRIDMVTTEELASSLPGKGASLVSLESGVNLQAAINALSVGGGGGDGGVPSSSVNTLVIGVIGDSLSVANALQETSWPQLFQEYINQSGGNIRIVNYSQNSLTFKKANEDAEFGTETAREALITAKPAIILCALGVVDFAANELNRTLTELQSDAASFYSALKAALPSTTLIQLRNRCFDSSTNAVATALKNRDVLPYFMQKRTSGILEDAYCSEMLNDNISAQQQLLFNQAEALYVYIDNLSEVSFIFDIDYWKIARAGLLGSDQLNPATYGKVLMCGYVAKAVIDNTITPDWGRLGGDKNYATWYNPDLLLNTVMDQSNDWAYVKGNSGPHHAANLTNLYKDIAPDVWYLPNKTSVSIARSLFTTGQPFTLSIFNGPASETIYPSIDGLPFNQADPSMSLTPSGAGVVSLIDPVAPGVYEFRYKCANEVYGPYNFEFVGGGTAAGTLALVDGGTGASTAAGARANLETYSKAEVDILTDGAPLFKVAVVGDSLSTENALHEHAWPSLMQKYINNSGGYCRVVNYARNSFTFAEAATDPNAFDGRTALQAIIDEKPDVVICAFGVVDVVANEAGKTLSTLQSEAASFYTALRTALPDAKLCHAEQVAYDKVNATQTALKNKDVIPYFMKRRTSGIDAGCFGSEMLQDTISSTMQANINNSVSFYSYIESLAEVDHMLSIDYWKIARIGLIGMDGLHPRSLGKVLQSGYVINALVSQAVDPFFAKLRTKNLAAWYNPDIMIDGIINKADNWKSQYFAESWEHHAANLNSLYKDVAPDSWYLPHKTTVSIPRTEYDADVPFHISVWNGPPGQALLPSVNGGAFDTSNPTMDLTITGNGAVSVVNPIGPGTYVFRYKSGIEIYGPYTFTFYARPALAVSSGGTGSTTNVGARSNLDVYSKSESDALSSGGVDAYTKVESDARFLNEASNLTDLNSANVAVAALGLTQDGPNSVSYKTGWTVGDSVNYRTPRYYKDHNGRVHLEGCVKRTSGTGVIAFTLPTGYRPSRSLGFATPRQGNVSITIVEFDGDIEISGYTTNGDLAFLDGISFMAN